MYDAFRNRELVLIYIYAPVRLYLPVCTLHVSAYLPLSSLFILYNLPLSVYLFHPLLPHATPFVSLSLSVSLCC